MVSYTQVPVQLNNTQSHRLNTTGIQAHNPVNPLGRSRITPAQRTQANNARIIEETQRKNYAFLREQQKDLYENREAKKTVSYTLPSLAGKPGTEHYRDSFEEIEAMLAGGETSSSKRAVFLVENAWYEDQGSYEAFERRLQKIIEFCQLMLVEEGYDETDPMAMQWMLQRFFSDTLALEYQGEKIEHLPFEYDFDDFWGHEDYTNMFVSKLLRFNSGQCHSLPLLYKLLADEAGMQAWLAFSPEHSYIRFQDKRGTWRNLELTNGKLTADSWISGSGYVKAEAVINQAYMDTLGDASTLAYCLTDLAQGYYLKYGFDPFVLECVDTALKYDPTSMRATLIRADYYTMTFKHVLEQIGRQPPPEELKAKYPEAYAVYLEWKAAQEAVEAMGYEPMPAEAYKEWLNSLEEETARREDKRLKEDLQQTIRIKAE